MLPISILCPQRKSGISRPLHDRLISSAADFSCRAREALMRTRSNTLAFSVPSTNRRGRACPLLPYGIRSPSPLGRHGPNGQRPAAAVPERAAPTGDASALGQPSQSGQVPPPPPSPYSGGQSYGGQPYGGQGSPAPRSQRPTGRRSPARHLNTYPEPGPYPRPTARRRRTPWCVPAPCMFPLSRRWVVPCWVFRLDETFVQRSTTRNQPLFYDSQQQTELLNSKTDLNFPVQTGFNVGAVPLSQRMGNRVRLFPVGRVDCQELRSRRQLDRCRRRRNATEIVPSTDTGVQYESCLYLSEINLRRQLNKWLDLLIGFRGGELDERYTAFSDTVTSRAGRPTRFTAFRSERTSNCSTTARGTSTACASSACTATPSTSRAVST